MNPDNNNDTSNGNRKHKSSISDTAKRIGNSSKTILGRLWLSEQIVSLSQSVQKPSEEEKKKFNIQRLDQSKRAIIIFLGFCLAFDIVSIALVIYYGTHQKSMSMITFELIETIIISIFTGILLFLYQKKYPIFMNNVRKRRLIIATYIFFILYNGVVVINYAILCDLTETYGTPNVFLIVNLLFMYNKFQFSWIWIVISIVNIGYNMIIYIFYHNLRKDQGIDYIITHICLYIIISAMGIYCNYKLQINIKIKSDLISKIEKDRNQLIQAQERYKQYMYSLFPPRIADTLEKEINLHLNSEKTIGESYNQVSVLFTDICGFTQMSSQMSPDKIVEFLNEIFISFDKIQEKYPRVEKIKTIGDAYVCVAGLQKFKGAWEQLQTEHNSRLAVEEMAEFSINIRNEIDLIAKRLNLPIQMRIGVTTGDVIAGVIGKDVFSFDVWGPPVNFSSLLESSGIPGKIHVSNNTKEMLQDKYEFEDRGIIDIKGSNYNTFFLLKRKEDVLPFTPTVLTTKNTTRKESTTSTASTTIVDINTTAEKYNKSISDSLQDNLNKFSLKFIDSTMEITYKKDEFRKQSQLMKYNGYFGAVLFSVLSVLIIIDQRVFTSFNFSLLGISIFAEFAFCVLYVWIPSDNQKLMQSIVLSQLIFCGSYYQIYLISNTTTYRMVYIAMVINNIYIYNSFGIAYLTCIMLSAIFTVITLIIIAIREPFEDLIYHTLLFFFTISLGVLMEYTTERNNRENYFCIIHSETQKEKLKEEQKRGAKLLRSIMPEKISKRLYNSNNATIADQYDDASVLFANINDFSTNTAHLNPIEQIGVLNKIFSRFDALTNEYNLQKIKTFGSVYMLVGGLPTQRSGHLEDVARMALKMQNVVRDYDNKFSLRIGISTGPVVAGVLGTTKLSYDLWSDTVNSASRMESNCIPNKIQVTETVYQALKDKFEFTQRGKMQIKGKGSMVTYFLDDEMENHPIHQNLQN